MPDRETVPAPATSQGANPVSDPRQRRTSQPRVLLACEGSYGAEQGAMYGAARYAHEHGPWQFLTVPWYLTPEQAVQQFAGRVDGMILRGAPRETLSLLTELGAAQSAVSVMTAHDGSVVPVVSDDESATARVAFEHLRGLGLTQFAFVGQWDLHTARSEAFVDECARHGYHCPLLASTRPGDWLEQLRALTQWLVALPKPVGLLAFEAGIARNVASACLEAKLRVPEDVAILAVGDGINCEIAHPPISAIDLGAPRMGWEAAALLHKLMTGNPLPTRRLIVEPAGVIPRHSTDVVVADSQAVSEAMAFIREAVGQGIKTEDVLQHVQVSRSFLEKVFKQQVGRTVHQEITRQRVQLTQQLLVTTDLPLPDLAERCGYSDRTQLSNVFRRETGQPPSTYRQTARRGQRMTSP